MAGLSVLTRILGAGTATQPAHGRSKRPAHSRSRVVKTFAKEEHPVRLDKVTGYADETILQRSRRDLLTIAACALATPTMFVDSARAEEPASSPVVSRKVYFDITVDGVSKGRVVIGLYGLDTPVGAQRFADLSKNIQGVGYRRSYFDKIEEAYIQNEGVRAFSYGDSLESVPITGGDDTRLLEKELASSTLRHTSAGEVSIIVGRDEAVLEAPKEKLKAVNGKLINVSEPPPLRPNGSQFVITTGPAPELDPYNLVVGRVLEGYELIEELSTLPTTKSNINSPFFKTAKAIGDSRATVAEKGFGRPFAKIVIKQSGLVADA